MQPGASPQLPPRPQVRKLVSCDPNQMLDDGPHACSLQRKPSKPGNAAGPPSVVPLPVCHGAAGPSTSAAAGPSRPAAVQEADAGFPDLHSAMRALASGQRPELLEQMGSRLRLTPGQVQQTASVVARAAQGGPISLQDLPAEVMHQAAHFHSLKGGALAPPFMAPSGSGGDAPRRPDSGVLGAEEEGQDWLDLYRGAYLKHADVALGPVLTSCTALLFWAGILPFWVALWLMPVTLALLVRLVLVKGAPALCIAVIYALHLHRSHTIPPLGSGAPLGRMHCPENTAFAH